jgi:hypothetical protein
VVSQGTGQGAVTPQLDDPVANDAVTVTVTP